MAFSSEIESAISKYSSSFGVDADLIRSIIIQESGGNPNAMGDYDVYGVPHSFGLMQLNDQGAGAGYSPEYLLNIDNNVRLGTGYLKSCLDAFPGDLKTAISAYNQGIAGARSKGWTHNADYVNSVLAILGKPIAEVHIGIPGEEISALGKIVPTDEETKTYWKNTFDKIASGCSIYIFITIIIIVIIIICVRY